MAGILDSLLNMSPQQNRGLLAAAAQILQQSGPSRRPFTIGQAMGTGIEAFQGSMEHQRGRELAEEQAEQMGQLRGLQIRDMETKLLEEQRQRDLMRQFGTLAKDSKKTAGQRAASLPGGPTVANLARIPEMQDGFDADDFLSKALPLDPLQALKFAQQFQKSAPEFDTTPRTGTDAAGNAFQYIISKGGKVQRLDGVLPRDEMKLASLGGRDVAYNPYALKEGQTFQRTMTPEGAANHSLARDRFNFDKSQVGKPVFSADAGGFILPPSSANPGGKLIPLAGSAGGKMTEDQAKSMGWLVQAENAYRNLRSVAFDKQGNLTSAATPGFADAIAGVPLIGGPIGNSLRSADRQKFNQASSALSEAFLRAATGAGVTESEARQKIAEITPVWGEDESVSQQKLNAIPLYIESLKARAGPGARKAAGVLGATPPSGGGVTFLGFE
ncbi:hypothetical protein [Massilia sp. DD77]|uniref:hypothetical protein n=1 Tax=Massilia sp. DD77 TaxID=3109349 RepID=UPI002FFEC459